MERVILHIDCNKFYASVECLHNPEIRNKPVAVGGSPETRHGIILTKNEPFLFHFPENPGSRHGHLPACSSLCASQKQTPRRIGAAALHRRRNRRSRHRIRPRPGIPPAQHLLLPWHSLRRRHRRQKPLHAAATAARMAGNPACGSFRGPHHLNPSTTGGPNPTRCLSTIGTTT